MLYIYIYTDLFQSMVYLIYRGNKPVAGVNGKAFRGFSFGQFAQFEELVHPLAVKVGLTNTFSRRFYPKLSRVHTHIHAGVKQASKVKPACRVQLW